MSLGCWLQQQWFPKAVQRHRGFWPTVSFFVLWIVLFPLHAFFVVVSGARRWAYRLGKFPVDRLPVPVVVVGNITVGGAGKTPLTLWLAEQFRLRGYRPGIISRGYRLGANKKESNNSAIEVTPESDAALVGDEPILLARRSACPVWVGTKRAEAGRALLAAHPEVNVLICDDGLQHLALARDVEVAVFDSRGIGNGWRLPLGPLRDPVSRLGSVDAVVFNGSVDPVFAQAVKGAPVFAMSLQPGTFYRLTNPLERCTAADLQAAQQKIYAVAGIGYPERFFQTLQALGLEISGHPFPDHHAYQSSDLDFAAEGVVLMTEKDAVKCAPLALANAWVLPVEAKISPALADTLLEKIHGHALA